MKGFLGGKRASSEVRGRKGMLTLEHRKVAGLAVFLMAMYISYALVRYQD